MVRTSVSIKIRLRQRRLYFYRGEQLYNSYPIAISKPSTPSPVGSWTIVNKKILNGRQVFGTRWMGLSKPDTAFMEQTILRPLAKQFP